MAAAQKKVIVRTFSGELAWGYLPQSGFLHEAYVVLMEVDGRLTHHAIKQIKTIAYVRDFNLDDRATPERLVRKVFAARPRGDGLWLRLTFRDEDVLEGLAAIDLAAVDGLVEDRGLTLTPPDTRGNTQRVFVPRTALQSMEVLGFVTAPSKRIATQTVRVKPKSAQADLFGDE